MKLTATVNMDDVAAHGSYAEPRTSCCDNADQGSCHQNYIWRHNQRCAHHRMVSGLLTSTTGSTSLRGTASDDASRRPTGGGRRRTGTGGSGDGRDAGFANIVGRLGRAQRLREYPTFDDTGLGTLSQGRKFQQGDVP